MRSGGVCAGHGCPGAAAPFRACASPDGDPSWLPIAFSHEKSSGPHDLAEELFHRFYLRSFAKSSEHQQPLSWHDIFRGKIGVRSYQHLQLQQADGDDTDHTRNRFPSCGTLVSIRLSVFAHNNLRIVLAVQTGLSLICAFICAQVLIDVTQGDIPS